MHALKLPGVSVENKAALMGRAVEMPVAITPAVIGGVVLSAAKAPIWLEPA